MFSMNSPYGHSKLPGAEGTGIATVKCAISKDTADAAVIFTVPAGAGRVRLNRAYWQNTTAWTGGTNSAIGLSSSNADYNTKGDLLGGAGGNVAAALGAGYKGGTVGAEMGSNLVVVLKPGDTIRFDRIVDAFTAGAGFAMLEFVAVEDDS
jgi:hypothetical protein